MAAIPLEIKALTQGQSTVLMPECIQTQNTEIDSLTNIKPNNDIATSSSLGRL